MHNDLQAEEDRLAALYAYELLDTAASEDFDRICRITAQSFDVPVALISLVDRDRTWFKAKIGYSLTQSDNKDSLCVHTIRKRGITEIVNAADDPRFCSHPMVRADNGICFYAGAPLVTSKGYALGSLCIIDSKPRVLTDAQRKHLTDLAAMVMQQIEISQWVRGRDPISGFPGRSQFVRDVDALSYLPQYECQMLVLIDILDVRRAQEIARALGIEPFERFVRTLSQRLRNHLSGLTTIYQVTLTRFAFILPIEPGSRHETLLDALMTDLRHVVVVDSMPILPPASAGVAMFNSAADEVQDAIRKALSAVEEALALQTPWGYFNPEADLRFRRRFNLAAEIQEAISLDQFFLVYQPRICTESKRAIGAEVLLRWQHPRLGLVPPAEFIPVIEQTPLIHSVTNWVIEHALEQLKCWGDQYQGTLSINLSPRDFDNGCLEDRIVSQLRTSGMAPARLELEITEGEWLRCNPSVLNQLKRLRTHGVAIALDDFGSGYSNFAYLHEIPADIVKLDRSLLSHIEAEPRKQLLVEHIIELVGKLGYRTVAEGIETRESFDLICRFKCDEAQGYYFARPLDASAFLAWYEYNQAEVHPCRSFNERRQGAAL